MKKKLFIAGVSLFMIFQSCTNEELSSQSDPQMMKTEINSSSTAGRSASESHTLKGFVANQLAIDAEIKTLLDEEVNINYSAIQAGLGNVKTNEELEQLYRNANVTHAEELVSLYKELSLHTEAFIKSNKDFYSSYNEEDRARLITAEIDSQIGYHEESGIMSKANCHANYVKASNRCMRNYAITMSFAAVSGFVSFGASTVIGAAAATAVMIACNSDADEDYHDCVHAGGTP
ncbi:hypothetical protein HNP38_001681 [Chryseobacterium defluvii]|uniref:Uncharacterized protein n=1 Tax=Chryseobacterium defluvii TaxID=160396 RepID=A0A840KAJ3_9FLAO|nr:hypothetical protein [Chryseobacterium defluvii]MBB4806409.1 hypothetical protein [Chryseobacterium defluvii]